MAEARRARKIIGVIQKTVLLWAVTEVFLVMLAAGGVTQFPFQAETPWSMITDSVMTVDGRVLLYSRLYERVLVYSQSGQFLGSWQGLSGGRGTRQLATTEDGAVFLCGTSGIILFRDSGGRERKWSAEGALTWLYLGRREVKVSGGAGEIRDHTADDLVHPGETICGPERAPRVSFVGSSGRRLERGVFHIRIVSPEGRVIGTVSPSWYLLFFQFPLPGLLPWLLIAAIGALRRRGADAR